MKRLDLLIACCLLFVTLLSACGGTAPTPKPTPPPAAKDPELQAPEAKPQTLRLTTTTSTADSGLLDFILPDFEKANNCKVDVVAVGSGQAIEIGSKGDADVLLVHSRKAEDQFVTDGHAKERFDVMYNDFIIVGPKADPAKIAGLASSQDAFTAIATAHSPFASRGDKSGTNAKELSVWASARITPTKEMKWYNSLGQGMGDTLLFSNEQNAYTLADRGTYLSMVDKLPNLVILFGGNKLAENKDKALLNPYGVLVVNPDKHPGVNYDLALKFVKWIVSVDEQKKIGGYGADKFGQPLFYPSSAEYKSLPPAAALTISSCPPLVLSWRNGGTVDEFISGLIQAINLIVSGDQALLEIVSLTLQVSGIALLLSTLVGLPIGAALGLYRVPGRRLITALLYTGMGLPPVVVGLFVYLMLSRSGPLGLLGWLFTPNAMVTAQTIIAFPLVTGLTMTAVQGVDPALNMQVRALGATRLQEAWTVLTEARIGVVAAIVAAFGGIISEVGAVMLVGGNIAGKTRVLTTAIVLNTRQGEFELALALGVILLALAFAANIALLRLR